MANLNLVELLKAHQQSTEWSTMALLVFYIVMFIQAATTGVALTGFFSALLIILLVMHFIKLRKLSKLLYNHDKLTVNGKIINTTD